MIYLKDDRCVKKKEKKKLPFQVQVFQSLSPSLGIKLFMLCKTS